MSTRRKVLTSVLLVFFTVGYASRAEAKSTHYIFIDGPAAGSGVLTDEFGENVDFGDTKGKVVDTEANCNGKHYHGTFNGDPDPAPNACGWGRVVPRDQGTKLLKAMSHAIDLELLALRSVRKDPPNWYNVHSACGASAKWLDEAIDDVRAAKKKGRISAEDASTTIDQLQAAKVGDKDCKKQAKSDDRDQTKVRAGIEDNLKRKRAALEIFNKNSLLVKKDKE